MSYFSKEAETAKKFDACLHKQVDLLVELAAAYVAHNLPVPPEVGEALGEVRIRQQEWASVRNIYVKKLEGPGVKEIVRKYIQKHQTDKIAKLLQRLQEVTDGGDQSSAG